MAQGHQVKALLRPGSDERGLAGVKFTRVTGDVFDRKLLEREMEGCDWCFHVAASYHLWLRDYKPMYAVNVEGTRNVLEAAGKAGCQRIVYTSTVGCVGLPKMVDGRLVPSTELDVISPEHLSNHYKCSKWQAECVATKLARDGLPIVIVNPTAPIGPRDVKPTPTGQVIVDFLNRKLPAYLDTGLNWVHVRDVAAGHILAAEKGELGERYILGNEEGNWTMRETLAALEEITGVPAPKWEIPYWVALAAAHVNAMHLLFHRQTAPGAAGGRAHGQIQNVVQSGPGDPGAQAAADAAETGARRRRRMVSRERVREVNAPSGQRAQIMRRVWQNMACHRPGLVKNFIHIYATRQTTHTGTD